MTHSRRSRSMPNPECFDNATTISDFHAVRLTNPDGEEVVPKIPKALASGTGLRLGRMELTMTEFTFQATLLASIRVMADTQAEAELKVRAALEASDANLGVLDGAPIVVPVEIEGELDLIETIENTSED
jgi:hypothetical protein